MTAEVTRRPAAPDAFVHARRRAASLTVASGALFVVVPLLVEFVTGEAFVLMGVAGLAMLAALPSLHRLHAGSDGRAGTWGLRAALLGLTAAVALLVLGEPAAGAFTGATHEILELSVVFAALLAVLVLVGGLVGLTVGMLRAGVLPKPPVVTFAGGLVLALGAEMFEQSLRGPVPLLADALPVLGFIVTGVGLLFIGWTVRRLSLS